MSQMRLAVDKIGRGRRTNQEIDISWGRAGFLQQAAYGLSTHVRGAQTFAAKNVSFFNSGALDDPLIAGVDHLRQFGVGQHVRGHIAVDPGDCGIDGGPPCGFGSFRLFGHCRTTLISPLKYWLLALACG